MRFARALPMFVALAAAAACGESSASAASSASAPSETAAQPAGAGARKAASRRAYDDEFASQIWRQWLARRESVPIREVTVVLASDEEFRAACKGDWKEDARRRLAAASAVFEREFRIRFVPVEHREWRSDPHAIDLHALHRAAAADLPAAPSELAIVFVRQDQPFSGRPDSYERGVTYYYGRTLLVRTGVVEGGAARPTLSAAREPRDWPYEHETLLHELAHTFGAWHLPELTSVMRPHKSEQPVEAFGVAASAAVVVGRGIDFRRGVDGLANTQIETITQLWEKSVYAGTEHPVLDALQARGWVSEMRGQFAAAKADYERAVVVAKQTGTRLPARLASRYWTTWQVESAAPSGNPARR